MTWATGLRFGSYELISRLGTGGMGEVWKARDARLDRIVAIKRLINHDETRFEQEARTVAALNHPNICHIYDLGPDNLVMEYVEGVPLRGPLRTDEALPLAIQIASALEEAHDKRILHRDLKPGNVLVTGKGAAKPAGRILIATSRPRRSSRAR
jgi:eukaryotic-like serine/threonine-protein kinase